MGVLNRYCGNCKRFENNGFGWCVVALAEVGCEHCCPNHEFSNNGWTEITLDNVEEVYGIDQDRLVVQYTGSDCPIVRMIGDFFASISTMAKCGGYYYYVLPELKIE